MNSIADAVQFEVNGAKHSLFFTFAAMRRFERERGETFLGAFMRLEKDGKLFDLMGALFRSGLSHSGDVTDDEVNEIIPALGFSKTIKLLQDAFAVSWPESDKAPPGNAKRAAPRKTTATS